MINLEELIEFCFAKQVLIYKKTNRQFVQNTTPKQSYLFPVTYRLTARGRSFILKEVKIIRSGLTFPEWVNNYLR